MARCIRQNHQRDNRRRTRLTTPPIVHTGSIYRAHCIRYDRHPLLETRHDVTVHPSLLLRLSLPERISSLISCIDISESLSVRKCPRGPLSSHNRFSAQFLHFVCEVSFEFLPRNSWKSLAELQSWFLFLRAHLKIILVLESRILLYKT